MKNNSFTLGIIGAGTVGGGVISLITQQKQFFSATMGIDLVIKTVCEKTINKNRNYIYDDSIIYTTHIDDILNDDTIDCILELIGGVTIAKHIVFESIKRGKHIITANKALIAEHLLEIEELLSKNPSVKFGFEASVCGGVPVIQLLKGSFLSDNIKQVSGIMNGTTNYILSKMESEGCDYSAVLKEAQDLGYAEMNPSADIDGHDVRSKIVILAKLAFGTFVPIDEVPMIGISRITADDFSYAKLLNCSIKMLGVSKITNNNSLCIYVSPAMIPLSSTISTISGAKNIVEITSDSMVKSSFIGEGAGRFPTANSVLSDILEIACNRASSQAFPKNTTLTIDNDFSSCFYIRITVKDDFDIKQKIEELCENNLISIQKIYLTPNTIALLTDFSTLSVINKLVLELKGEDFCTDNTFFMPVKEKPKN